MSADPTAIQIALDPTQQRISGVAIHGNARFDVPLISEVVPGLWQGGCRDGLVLPEHIEHVISLYPWEAYTARHQLISRLTVRLYDALDVPDRAQLVVLAQWVNVCRAGGNTLVHCQAGLNRSGLIAGLALVLAGTSPLDAIARLRSSRSSAVLCNPAFEKWLLEFDGETL